MKTSEIITTAAAKCRDCYRCVRACPVKAIGIKDGQAYIDGDKCVLCGTCVRECPQNAKIYRSDIDLVKSLLKNNDVVVSIAPSFPAVFEGWKAKRLPSALRKLGFSRVEETSIGADMVSAHTSEHLKENDAGAICSPCPAAVFYIEKYAVDAVDSLLPLCSPMIAHGKIIKKDRPKSKVVFIGPCIAKKAESARDENKGVIDAVLTFTELVNWLEAEGIRLDHCPESDFDRTGISDAAKIFALPGGMLKTVGILEENSVEIMHTSGAHNTKMLIDAAISSDSMEVIEPLFCSDGCINGPGIKTDSNIFQRRNNIISYSKDNSDIKKDDITIDMDVDLHTEFYKTPFEDIEVSESQIQEIFEKTGKSNSEYRLDCGACGYPDCRANAKAIIIGMAEPEMCLPYMRRIAEQRSSKIIENSPNGIVILDEDKDISSMNSAFREFFTCNNLILGRPISYLVNTGDYNKVSASDGYVQSIVKCYGKEFHQLVYYLEEERQYIGIYVDISNVKLSQAKLEAVKKQTLEHVELLMQHQVEMAQQMTVFLGESTAKSETLLESLISLDD